MAIKVKQIDDTEMLRIIVKRGTGNNHSNAHIEGFGPFKKLIVLDSLIIEHREKGDFTKFNNQELAWNY
jgi:hypothetical protein